MPELTPEQKEDILAVGGDPRMPENVKTREIAKVVTRSPAARADRELELRDLKVIWGSAQKDIQAQAAAAVASKPPPERRMSIRELKRLVDSRVNQFQRAFDAAIIRPQQLKDEQNLIGARPAMEQGVLPAQAFASGLGPDALGFDFRKFRAAAGDKGVEQLLQRHPELLQLMGEPDE